MIEPTPLSDGDKRVPFFCSWSGGKDSCLALHRAVHSGGVPRALLTMLDEGGERTRSHGIPLTVLKAQASALGIDLVTRSTSWNDYEKVFVSALRELGERGIPVGVFGDIDIEPHRQWEENVCRIAGLTAHLPLWQVSRTELLSEFMALGFCGLIVSAKVGLLNAAFLGRPISAELVNTLVRKGIDPSGEEGEFHTLVVNGPLFRWPVKIKQGKRVQQDGYWFLETELER